MVGKSEFSVSLCHLIGQATCFHKKLASRSSDGCKGQSGEGPACHVLAWQMACHSKRAAE